RFHGIIKNVIDEIRDARMLLLTSDYEGIPNVVLEAFVAGIPVVSTDCSPGGARFLLGDDENGLLAPVGDPIRVAQKMGEIADNLEEALRLIRCGRERLKEFGPEKIFFRWEDYLKHVGRL
ncbi:glycosyltransferase, partial [Candidatus Saccharibacteria bacterium]|nr:glycosyltransferase [Candidatus Saccharibacteria bacterium]